MSKFRYSAMSLSCIDVQRLDVVVGPEQPEFLGAPEAEPHRVLHLRRSAQLQRGFQHRRHPGTVVVDARALRHAVEVRADHHDVGGGAGLGLGDDVARVLDADTGVELDGGGARRGRAAARPSALVTLMTGIFTSVFSPSVPPISSPSSLLATISADRAALGGRRPACAELALAAVDQHDGTRDRQAVVVGCRAARGVLDAGGDQRTATPVRRVPMVNSSGLAATVRRRDGQRRLVGERQAHLELGRLHVETLVPQRIGHVVDAGVVARRAERAVAVVGVGDLLQLLQVRHHRVGRDLLQRRAKSAAAGAVRRCSGCSREHPTSAASAASAASSATTAVHLRRTSPTLAARDHGSSIDYQQRCWEDRGHDAGIPSSRPMARTDKPR